MELTGNHLGNEKEVRENAAQTLLLCRRAEE